MSELFDDISRIVGSHLPRRRMLKLIAGVFAGGALPAALWPTRTAAFEACRVQFDIFATGQEKLNQCSTSGLLNDPSTQTACCDNALVVAKSAAKQHCLATCPYAYVVSASDPCTLNNPPCNEADDTMMCSGTWTFYCYCNAPSGQSCCTENIYCNTNTQKCCGTYCGPINQTCSGNPTNPR